MSGVSNTKRLRSLIAAVRERQGWTYDEIARRSQGALAKSTVHKIATQVERDDPPPVAHLRALAEALGVPFEEVRDAALADAGLLPRQGEALDVMGAIRQDQQLLPEARSHLLNQYQLLLRVSGPASQEAGDAEIIDLPRVARKRPAPGKRRD